jgi:hypothetical protein
LIARTQKLDDMLVSQMLKAADKLAGHSPEVSAGYLRALTGQAREQRPSFAAVLEKPANVKLFKYVLENDRELIAEFQVKAGLSQVKDILDYHSKFDPNAFGFSTISQTTAGEALFRGMPEAILELQKAKLDKKSLFELIALTKTLMQRQSTFPDVEAPWLDDLVDQSFQAIDANTDGLTEADRTKLRLSLLNAPRTMIDRKRFVLSTLALQTDTSPQIQAALARYSRVMTSGCPDLWARIGVLPKKP